MALRKVVAKIGFKENCDEFELEFYHRTVRENGGTDWKVNTYNCDGHAWINTVSTMVTLENDGKCSSYELEAQNAGQLVACTTVWTFERR